MKRTLRFILVLLALLTLMGIAQGAMVGACDGSGQSLNGFVCPD